MSKSVLIISASDSDLPILSDATKTLEQFGIAYEITISSAHRSPDRTMKLVQEFYIKGGKIIICAAGLAAHLAGMVAAHFPLPVIGIPLAGQDAMYSTLQMPPGIPVATVGVDNAKNAALLAVQILATSDKDIEEKMINYRKQLSETIEEKAKKLENIGLEKYLSEKK